VSSIVYILTCLTTLLCAILLLKGYAQSRRKLLLWSGLCFVVLTVSNGLVFADLVVYRSIDLFTYRLVAEAVAMVLLLYGLIWESQ
jgi:hypothetical protein